MQEILNKREERCKHFDLGNGQMQFVGYTAPIHYKNALTLNKWEDIVLDFKDDGKGNYITDKNKVSCGFRKDKKLEKYFGLRYDADHQFEVTINKILLDGAEQIAGSDFNVAAIKETKNIVSNELNANVRVINRLNEVSLKNYFCIHNPVEDFEIVEELHLKGLTCSNKKDGDNYIPDERGRFNFVDEKGEWKFGIRTPFFIDDARQIHFTVQHELKEISGRLFYTKTPTLEGKDDFILKNVKFPIEVDADTIYGETTDGRVSREYEATWDSAHDTADGEASATNQEAISPNTFNNWSGKADVIYLERCFLYFDTSGIGAGATVTAAVLSLFGKTTGSTDTGISVQLGTQGATLGTTDYNNFSGTYFALITAGNFSHSAYNEFTLNAAGRSAIVVDGETKYCVREYDHDYLDSDPGSGVSWNYGEIFFAADEIEEAEQRPRLVVTYTSGPAVKSINGVAYASVKSVNGVINASIKSINGIT